MVMCFYAWDFLSSPWIADIYFQLKFQSLISIWLDNYSFGFCCSIHIWHSCLIYRRILSVTIIKLFCWHPLVIHWSMLRIQLKGKFFVWLFGVYYQLPTLHWDKKIICKQRWNYFIFNRVLDYCIFRIIAMWTCRTIFVRRSRK